MNKFRTFAAALALALVASACSSAVTEEAYVEPEESRNAALGSDNGMPTPGLDCCVRDIAKDSAGNIWVGGDFTTRGLVTGGAAQLTPSSTGIVLPRVTGIVTKIIPDGSNGYYLAGLIGSVGTAATGSIVHITSAGELDRAFAPVLPAGVPVVDIALGADSSNQRVLYASLPGSVIKLNAATGAAGGPLQITYRGLRAVPQNALLAATTRGIVVAGDFIVDGAEVVTAVAMTKAGLYVGAADVLVVDAQGQVTGWGTISAIATHVTPTGGDVVHVGGSFNTVGVRTPATDSVQLDVGNATRLSWDNAGLASGPGASFDGRVSAIAVGTVGLTTTVHFGGQFRNARASNAVAARWAATYSENPVTGSRSIAPLATVNGPVNAISASVINGYETVLLSGPFTVVDNQSRHGLVLLARQLAQANAAWFAVGNTKFIKTDSAIRTSANGAAGIVVGGTFSVAGYPVPSLIKMDADGRFVAGLNAVKDAPNGPVRAIAIRDGLVYVGGKFDAAGNNLVTSFVRYLEDGTYDGRMRVLLSRESDLAEVNDIALDGRNIHVGGVFDSIGGFGMRNYAALDARELIQTDRYLANTDGPVESIAVGPDGTSVAVVGSFKSIGGVTVNGSAVLTGEAGDLSGFRSRAAAGSDVRTVAFAPDGQSLFVGYRAGEASLVRYSLRGDVLHRFLDLGARVGALGAGGDRVYVGLDDRSMKVFDVYSNEAVSGFGGFAAGTTALVADESGAWMGGRGFKIGANPVYGPVRISSSGEVLVNPSSAANAEVIAPGVASGGSATPAPETPANQSEDALTGPPVGPTELPFETVVHQGVSSGTGRVADAAGNEFGYRITSDGTIVLNKGDVDKSASRNFMVTKLKPGNRAVTVSFATPVGLRNVKVKAHPSGRNLTCSPGRKKSCTIKGLDPAKTYRFSVEGKLGKKSATSPRSFATKPLVSLKRGTTASLFSLLGNVKGKPAYTATGGCRIVSKKTRVSTPRLRTTCVVSVAADSKGTIRTRSVVVKVG